MAESTKLISYNFVRHKLQKHSCCQDEPWMWLVPTLGSWTFFPTCLEVAGANSRDSGSCSSDQPAPSVRQGPRWSWAQSLKRFKVLR